MPSPRSGVQAGAIRSSSGRREWSFAGSDLSLPAAGSRASTDREAAGGLR